MTTSFSAISDRLGDLAIEVPSWAYGNSGTRFKVFGSAGTPRTVEEKIADAAAVHRFTGLAPTVALHIPWDQVDDYAALATYAKEQGVALGTINSNTFQDDDYKLGALTHTDPRVRQKAIDHHLACIEVMHQTGSRDLKIWLAEGTNYPGQGDMRGRQDRLAEGLRTIYDAALRGAAAGAGVQVLRAGVLPHRRPGLGHVVRPRGRPRRPRDGLPRHRPPRPRHQHRVHRRAAAAAREARLVRLQQPLLRRRRPDRRRGRSRTSCSGSWSRSSAAAASATRPTARPTTSR